MNEKEKRIRNESMEIVLEKIKRELEFKSYLLMKEEFVLIKEIFLGKDNQKFFKGGYSFDQIFYGVENNTGYGSFNYKKLASLKKKKVRRSDIINDLQIARDQTKQRLNK
mgnify:CR=1 FL=1